MASRRKRTQQSRVSGDDPLNPTEDVGYGRPPKPSQFKPGRSGNPRGRPKGALNGKTILQRNLSRKITVRQGETQSRVSNLEGIVMRLVELSLKGDTRAAQQLMKIAIDHGAIAYPTAEAEQEQLSAAEQEIIQAIIAELKKGGK